MPLLGFKRRFAPKVKSGEKRQTIRSMRKRPIKVGDKLFHYVGLRTKKCKKLLESACKKVEYIIMRKHHDFIFVRIGRSDEYLDMDGLHKLAVADGFNNFEEFKDFFKNRLPFEGQIIYW
jgi:hypothetical protein